MKILNIRIWAPFYIIGLLIIVITMWTVEAARPTGIALWICTLVTFAIIGLNFYLMRGEIKAQEKREEKFRELSGLDPIQKKSVLSLFKR